MNNWGALFSGQGSQHPGMGKFLFDQFKICRQKFEEASDAIGIDFKKLCFDSSEEELALTENTQPALLLVSVCSFEALAQNSDIDWTAAAGHSIGEYAALVTAGAMSFSDAIKAVRKRGQAMQSAVPIGEGAMIAVMGLSQTQTETLCKWAKDSSGFSPVDPANYNAPGQIVISGNSKAIDWMQKNFNPEELFDPVPRRTRLIPLKVSAPFHCELMKPAQDTMNLELNEINFKDAMWPIIQNVCAEPTTDAESLRKNLIEQISAPVRWIECIEKLRSLEVSKSIEFGPGKVLSGLTKKIDKENLTTFNLNSLEELKSVEKQLS